MKTPREILFARHAEVTPQLDSIREQALSRQVGPAQDTAAEPVETAGPVLSGGRRPGHGGFWQEPYRWWRWHFAALSAAWVLIVLLSYDPATEPSAGQASKALPPQLLLSTLQENRRLLQDTEVLPARGSAPPVLKRVPAPRSQIQIHTSMT
jgi:hypothetical protein